MIINIQFWELNFYIYIYFKFKKHFYSLNIKFNFNFLIKNLYFQFPLKIMSNIVAFFLFEIFEKSLVKCSIFSCLVRGLSTFTLWALVEGENMFNQFSNCFLEKCSVIDLYWLERHLYVMQALDIDIILLFTTIG